DLGYRPLRRPAVDGEVDGRGDTRDLCPVGLRDVDEGAGGDRLRVADDVLGRLHGRPPHAGAVEDRTPLGERAGGEDLVEQADQHAPPAPAARGPGAARAAHAARQRGAGTPGAQRGGGAAAEGRRLGRGGAGGGKGRGGAARGADRVGRLPALREQERRLVV